MGRKAGRPTIADVAAAAQVSRATVSRVLNGSSAVDGELERRVRLAADRLGYRPNLTALGLARGFTGMVGVIVPDLANPFFPTVLKALEAAAGADNCRVIIADSNEDEEQEVRLAEELSRRCDGIVLCAVRMSTSQLRHVARTGAPMVLVNRVEPALEIASAAIDFAIGVDAAMDHLAELGHRRVGYLAGPPHAWSNVRRLAAFKAAAKRLGVKTTVVPAGSATADAYAAMPELIDAGVTAVLAYNDLVAFGALERLWDYGLSAPADISLVGFDDIPAARFAAPPMTTVRLPKAELGTAAWELLRERTERNTVGKRWLAPEFLVRGSTGPPRERP
jgi:LacI family transcriptional regulator